MNRCIVSQIGCYDNIPQIRIEIDARTKLELGFQIQLFQRERSSIDNSRTSLLRNKYQKYANQSVTNGKETHLRHLIQSGGCRSSFPAYSRSNSPTDTTVRSIRNCLTYFRIYKLIGRLVVSSSSSRRLSNQRRDPGGSSTAVSCSSDHRHIRQPPKPEMKKILQPEERSLGSETRWDGSSLEKRASASPSSDSIDSTNFQQNNERRNSSSTDHTLLECVDLFAGLRKTSSIIDNTGRLQGHSHTGLQNEKGQTTSFSRETIDFHERGEKRNQQYKSTIGQR
ncbi:MAG: hypothetical protein EZS28_028331 [Streblomastix strix]|uniref:Uncharacterized protein n=1 Tax=Streblomastix strix TaxID=222440 RepID=A0A5J4V1A1_9EUKA|nr:MAG: hypothetical protein EZS28_028331 [Streblomastix strix]